MGQNFTDFAFTPSVKAAQSKFGCRESYQRIKVEPDRFLLTDCGRDYISTLDFLFMATRGESGWPYVQNRGGPKGFLKLLGARNPSRDTRRLHTRRSNVRLEIRERFKDWYGDLRLHSPKKTGRIQVGSPNSRNARCANRDARYRKVSITHGTVRNKDLRLAYRLMKSARSQAPGSLFYVNIDAGIDEPAS